MPLSAVTHSIQDTVLCWLATIDKDGTPNISPKEAFSIYKNDALLIANIASPNSHDNIISNTNICACLVDVLSQKGYKIKGQAEIIMPNHKDFALYASILKEEHGNDFPYQSIFYIKPANISLITAPAYQLFEDMDEEELS